MASKKSAGRQQDRGAPQGGAPRGGAPRGGGARSSGGGQEELRPQVVGGERNEHGTRISRRVECSRCGKVDHVPWGKRDRKGALCRSCAAETLKAFEIGTKKKVETRPVTCNLCGKPFDLPKNVEDDGDLLCVTCLRGFFAWQGDVDSSWEDRAKLRSESRPSGTLLRRRNRNSGTEPAPSEPVPGEPMPESES